MLHVRFSPSHAQHALLWGCSIIGLGTEAGMHELKAQVERRAYVTPPAMLNTYQANFFGSAGAADLRLQ